MRRLDAFAADDNIDQSQELVRNNDTGNDGRMSVSVCTHAKLVCGSKPEY